MSMRGSHGQPALPASHYFVTFARGHRIRTISIRPAVLFAAVGVLSLLAVWYLVATVYFVFRDEMLASLMHGEAQMQYAYEDRLADMRTQLEKSTSRQMLDDTSMEGKIQALVSRQALLEMRSGIVAALSEQLGISASPDAVATGSPPRRADAGRLSSRLARATATVKLPMQNPDDAQSALTAPWAARDGAGKPHLEAPRAEISLSRAARDTAGPQPIADPLAAAATDARMPASLRLGFIADRLKRIEAAQLRSLTTIGRDARLTVDRFEVAINTAGLSANRFKRPNGRTAGAEGGPFVPMPSTSKGDISEGKSSEGEILERDISVESASLERTSGMTPFEQELGTLRQAIATAAKLRRLLAFMPLRQPFPAGAEMTSGFGGRTDPFNGRVAMHTGVDFASGYGAPVRTTAAGRVRIAAAEGGYGNMVEIDHGFGLTTRYGHLSAIGVVPGQQVEAGAVIGNVGSTGRSTGPHLHYETRIDGEAVDPLRFLRAGRKFFAAR